MTDFLAGQTLTPLHFPPAVSDAETGLFTFNATTYGEDNDSGTYAQCAVVFVAPTTGRELILYEGQLSNSAVNGTCISPYVRTGATIGSGTDVSAASDNTRIFIVGTSGARFGGFLVLSGLTAGDSYNVLLTHKVTGGIGTALHRAVTAMPLT